MCEARSRTAAALAFLLTAAPGAHAKYRRSENREEYVISPRMHEALDLRALPAELDWRSKDGKNYTTVTRNQHIPQYCGACYSFGATAALSDRIRIATGGTGREVTLSMQVLLNCDFLDYGCSGGDGLTVYQWIHKYGIPDETCQPYESRGYDVGNTCEAQDICRRCDAKGCRAQEKYDVYGVAEYGHLTGERQMLAELQRGPIACAIATPKKFINWSGWEIYEDQTGDTNIDHIISVVGYGTENGKDYWILRNSWGTYWGYYGWARVARGSNNIQIEKDCAWATPSNGGRPVWGQMNPPKHKNGKMGTAEFLASKPIADERERKEVEEADREEHHIPCRTPESDWGAAGGEVVIEPRPHEVLDSSSLPSDFDWRNVSGRSYATWNTNEHVPHGRCASCWAHAVTSALGDRIAVTRRGAWPQVGLSPQVLLNCRGGGSCSGGDPAQAYAYIAQYGITDETCQNYQATEFECRGQYICRNCAPNGEKDLSWPGVCVGVKNPIVWFISEYGAVRGAVPMKAEIYKRGPISCGMQSTKSFRRYRGGVFEEKLEHKPRLTHQVSLTGWGKHGEPEHWIGRNSWGTYWGEGGWFRIKMHDNNLGIETECDWAVPSPVTAPVPSTRLVAAPAAAAEEEEELLYDRGAAAVGLDMGATELSLLSSPTMERRFDVTEAPTLLGVLAVAMCALVLRYVRPSARIRMDDSAPYVLIQ